MLAVFSPSFSGPGQHPTGHCTAAGTAPFQPLPPSRFLLCCLQLAPPSPRSWEGWSRRFCIEYVRAHRASNGHARTHLELVLPATVSCADSGDAWWPAANRHCCCCRLLPARYPTGFLWYGKRAAPAAYVGALAVYSAPRRFYVASNCTLRYPSLQSSSPSLAGRGLRWAVARISPGATSGLPPCICRPLLRQSRFRMFCSTIGEDRSLPWTDVLRRILGRAY